MPAQLETLDELKYVFHPVKADYMNFKVRAPNDAHIALTSNAVESDPMLEIFIGGWENSKSVIRKNRTKPDVVETETPGILNAGEYRGFWIRWIDDVITVGNEGENVAFMSYQNSEPFPIRYFGVCTGWGATGSWILEDAAKEATTLGWTMPSVGSGPGIWVSAQGGEVPPNAVQGGYDGEPLYIARAIHEGDLVPGKLVPSHGVCYVPYDGGEHSYHEYEVLCSASGVWVPCSNSDIPGHAIPAGETDEGEPLFIGRANHNATITIGKVHPSHCVCYIPYGHKELAFTDYEIFVTN